jgi:hypothetical protein
MKEAYGGAAQIGLDRGSPTLYSQLILLMLSLVISGTISAQLSGIFTDVTFDAGLELVDFSWGS